MLLIYRENPYRSLHIVRLYILVVVLGDPFLWFQFCTCVVGVCNPHFLLMYLVFAPTIGILELLGCYNIKLLFSFRWIIHCWSVLTRAPSNPQNYSWYKKYWLWPIVRHQVLLVSKFEGTSIKSHTWCCYFIRTKKKALYKMFSL